MSLQAGFRRHEQAKKREYGECVHEVEHGVFTPLVLSIAGGLDHEATNAWQVSSIRNNRNTIPSCAG